MNVFAKFDEIPSLILQDIMETKQTDTRSVGRTVGQRENSIPLPQTDTVCGGIKTVFSGELIFIIMTELL